MRMTIRKRFFDDLVSGRKGLELRDAHLTFVCEETGRVARADVDGVVLYSRSMSENYLKKQLGVGRKLFDEIFEDEWQVAFSLKNIKKVKG